MNPQLAGMIALPGTYVFDVRTSVKTYRLNRFFWRLTQPEAREAYMTDPEQACQQAGLTNEETDLVRRQDWIGLIRYGVNFFVLEKFARVLRLSNMHMYAQMRGETLEAFLQTRNVPTAAHTSHTAGLDTRTV